MMYKGFEIYVEYNTYEIFRLTDDGSLGEFVDSESDGSLRGYSAYNGSVVKHSSSLDGVMQSVDDYLENIFNPTEKSE